MFSWYRTYPFGEGMSRRAVSFASVRPARERNVRMCTTRVRTRNKRGFSYTHVRYCERSETSSAEVVYCWLLLCTLVPACYCCFDDCVSISINIRTDTDILQQYHRAVLLASSLLYVLVVQVANSKHKMKARQLHTYMYNHLATGTGTHPFNYCCHSRKPYRMDDGARTATSIKSFDIIVR